MTLLYQYQLQFYYVFIYRMIFINWYPCIQQPSTKHLIILLNTITEVKWIMVWNVNADVIILCKYNNQLLKFANPNLVSISVHDSESSDSIKRILMYCTCDSTKLWLKWYNWQKCNEIVIHIDSNIIYYQFCCIIYSSMIKIVAFILNGIWLWYWKLVSKKQM